jgi:hypothetical protein
MKIGICSICCHIADAREFSAWRELRTGSLLTVCMNDDLCFDRSRRAQRASLLAAGARGFWRPLL